VKLRLFVLSGLATSGKTGSDKVEQAVTSKIVLRNWPNVQKRRVVCRYNYSAVLDERDL